MCGGVAGEFVGILRHSCTFHFFSAGILPLVLVPTLSPKLEQTYRELYESKVLQVDVVYPIEFRGKGAVAFGVFQFSRFEPSGIGEGEILMAYDDIRMESAPSIALYKFDRHIGTAIVAE
jgi:hypothetical protein